ncbi:hypothetical protein KSP39_PZI001341 [Platanthera zijinensis]|uniref:Uncharacterized protein n=1 Tax=Platanthera zijinensis TaxID=2320716 RepID=A0AAP0C3V2_9ASPA
MLGIFGKRNFEALPRNTISSSRFCTWQSSYSRTSRKVQPGTLIIAQCHRAHIRYLEKKVGNPSGYAAIQFR